MQILLLRTPGCPQDSVCTPAVLNARLVFGARVLGYPRFLCAFDLGDYGWDEPRLPAGTHLLSAVAAEASMGKPRPGDQSERSYLYEATTSNLLLIFTVNPAEV